MSWFAKNSNGTINSHPCIASLCGSNKVEWDKKMHYQLEQIRQEYFQAGIELLDDILTLPDAQEILNNPVLGEGKYDAIRSRLLQNECSVYLPYTELGYRYNNDLKTGLVHWLVLVPRFVGEHLPQARAYATYKMLRSWGIRPILAATFMWQFRDVGAASAGRGAPHRLYYCLPNGWGDQSPFNQNYLWEDMNTVYERWSSYQNIEASPNTLECEGVNWWGEQGDARYITQDDREVVASAVNVLKHGIPVHHLDFTEDRMAALKDATSAYQTVFNSLV
jgi:hypothetical protein